MLAFRWYAQAWSRWSTTRLETHMLLGRKIPPVCEVEAGSGDVPRRVCFGSTRTMRAHGAVSCLASEDSKVQLKPSAAVRK